ncbi:MAG: alpha/beta hydrolase [Pseudomonadales bacterium]|nr:alpha/beta hydrolase [Pseudomonadales bacterium]
MANESISPPGFLLRLLEGRAAAEAGQLLMQLPLLRLTAKRGDGASVLVLPGFMADDSSTALLRAFLVSIGYDARAWELGTNRRRMLDFLAPVTDRIARLSRDGRTPVRLVGWSRGGIIAREVARDRPDLVDRVITIGTPVKGGTSASSIGQWVRRETGMTPVEMSDLLRARQSKPIRVPIRAIYSRYDGVVAWRACVDDSSPDVQHFEIRGSHVGMGSNVEVFRLLPELLAD